MKKYIIVATVMGLFILGLGGLCFAGEFVWENISRENSRLNTVLVDPDNPDIIYAGSNNGILKTIDAGISWRNIFSVKGQTRAVNLLLFDPQNKNYLYAATGNGLFRSNDQGKTWKRIFRGKNSLENECTCIAVLSKAIYVGTRGGLFVSLDKGRSWYKEKSELGNSNILAIAYNKSEPDYIYVACIDGVFQTNNQGESWERIFVTHPVENGSDAEEDTEDSDEEERFSGIRHISCAIPNLNCLYLATSGGVQRSCDSGKNWESISGYGLLNQDVKFLLFSDRGDLYAITKSGVFGYKAQRWQELSFGLPADDVRFLALDNRNNLYAACDKGLFKTRLIDSDDDGGEDIISLYFKDEPKINEVQQAAIKYAEVSSEKIKDWRRKANMKAILPKLTVGLDRSENTNYEIYTSATTRYVYEGPRDKSNGWDVTLSWELGDLIWNIDQTSIDVRSRLMVQLRDDILDEVTRLYFERIRVKMEINNLSIEDKRKRAEKELRLQELTASLDALTGGYFSNHLPNRDTS